MTAARQTVCLCMIVKNEAAVIRRCLDSVRPLIDHWLIVDTGSTDGTQDLVRRHFAGLPGTLHERPWQDFAHNRSEALSLARPLGDYSLIIDADDEMLVPPIYRLPLLTRDSYGVDIEDGAIAYQRTQLVSNALPWRFRGVLHEFLTCEGAGEGGHLPVRMRRNHDGRRRRDPSTYHNDVAVLKTALAGETDPFLTARYTFYLAQSHRDCGEFDAAIDAYLRRAGLGHWDQEIFCSLYQAAKMMEALGRDREEILDTYKRATDACPTRAEAAHGASRYCRLRDDFVGGFAIAKPAIDLAAPAGGLFVETWIYEFGLLDEYAVNAYWVGDDEACAGACRAILRTQNVPSGDRERAAQNLKFALDRLRPDHRGPSANKPDAAATSNWQPDRPLGGTELMVEGLRSRLGSDLDRISLGINAPPERPAPGKPSIAWMHHDVDQRAVQWCRDAIAVRAVSIFVFVSYWQRERYLRVFDLPPERCVVIRNATSLSRPMRAWRKSDHVRVAYTSTPFRGLSILLDAWEALKPRNACLHIYSSMRLYGPDARDDDYTALYERAARMESVSYEGLLPNETLKEQLRSIDILAYPCTFAETSCLSAIEAMSAGCRVICPAIGALPETTFDFARLYFPAADAQAHATLFERELQAELADPWGGRPHLQWRQQEWCHAVYDWDKRIEEWRHLIERQLGT